jgi:biofilm PGA synthesis N-glycosyltransferase PgaC
MPYITIKNKFIITVALSTAWMLLSIWLSIPWYEQLSEHTSPAIALFLIGFIAIIPGFMNAFIMIALALDKRPGVPKFNSYPSVTVLVAAYNEASSIEDTVRSLMRQDYEGQLDVVVINDGSADQTAHIVRGLLPEFSNLRLIDLEKNAGKANALNQGLTTCQTQLVITVDADCWIWKNGIQNLVGRRMADPANTRAVAGAILIRNSRQNWLTKAQEWDYFLGIAAIKRIQSLFQGTLVAQGAFSVYDRDVLIEVGGWPETVGEDIVLTWKILRAGYRVGHAENAIAMTRCPDNLKQFIRQRQRWSRGLIEAFKMTPDLLLKRRLPVFYIWWNTLFPLMDLAYTLGFIPGLILALFGHFWIVGPMTLALLPISFLMNTLMYSRSKATFDEVGLTVRRNRLGLISYALVYSIILQPACVWGYISEILNLRKTWGTK